MADESRRATVRAQPTPRGARVAPWWLAALERGPIALVVALVLVTIVRPRPFADDGLGGAPEPLASAEGVPSAMVAEPSATVAASDRGDDLARVLGDSARVRAAEDEVAARLRINDLKGAVAALERLIDLSPGAAKDAAVRERVVDLSVRAMFLTGDEPERVFRLLSTRMGTTGIDILYQLATTKGGSRAAKYAEKLLDDAQLLEKRGSPAVRIAWEFYRAPTCDAKKALLRRAADFGDARTLGQLQALAGSCGRWRRKSAGACCLADDPELDGAIDALTTRLGR